MFIDYNNKAVLITGGTKGIGKAIGLAFARQGAIVYLTYKWGNHNEDELYAEFADCPHKPVLIQSDVAAADDIKSLFTTIKEKNIPLHAIISNVAFAQIVQDMDALKKNVLDLSLNYSAWPIVSLTKTAYAVLNYYPKYITAISSDGADICHPGYDLAGSSKAVLETLVKYLALRLKKFGTRVNAVRPGFVDTESSRATFSPDVLAEINRKCPGIFLDPKAIAGTVLCLCSGAMDAVTGQILVIDEGWSLVSPIQYITGNHT